MEAINDMKAKVPRGEEEQEWEEVEFGADEFGGLPRLLDGRRDHSGLDYRKVFLRSYPLMWEKADMEIERVTIIKCLKRRLKKVLVKMIVLRKLKQKIAEYQSSKSLIHGYGFLSKSPTQSLLQTTTH
jgi:hypothetical protein